MEQNLVEKTGKNLEQWKQVLAAERLEKHSEMVKYLKSEHGITHGFANFIALRFREADAASSSEDDLVENQYAGKDALKPIYEKLKALILTFGDDIEVAPKKAAVSMRRKRQFALIQPSTKTRVDLGLKFNDKPHDERLETSGPFGTMCTHRVRLTSVDEVDQQLTDWLLEAYQEAG